MADRVLFQMYEGFRQRIINKHNFYVDQGQKRLLAQFADIEGEADAFAKKWLEDHGQHFDPEYHDPADFYENAHEEAIEFYELLSDMHDSTRLSIITGMFHEWEKQLRDWLVREFQHWPTGEALKAAIWKANFDQIIELLGALGWKVKSQPFYEQLDLCRLVVNVYKHGEGGSFERLKSDYPEFFPVLWPADLEDDDPLRFFDPAHLEVTDDHLDEFSNAIIAFWQAVPDEISISEKTEVPKWFEKAMIKDRAKSKAN